MQPDLGQHLSSVVPEAVHGKRFVEQSEEPKVVVVAEAVPAHSDSVISVQA